MIDPEERALLAEVARDVHRRHNGHLEQLKERGRKLIERADFLWHRLVKGFAMWSGASRWDRLKADRANLERLAYEALAELAPSERYGEIQGVFKRAGIRWPNKKARYLVDCVERIDRMGGPEEATELLFDLEGAEAKRRFLMSLPGIGPKYARNMMMDAHHEDFRDTIAVDARIKQISQSLDLSFSNYEDEETFYQRVAQEAGLSSWELDRLIYNYTEEFLEALGEKVDRPAPQGCKPGHAELNSRGSAPSES